MKEELSYHIGCKNFPGLTIGSSHLRTGSLVTFMIAALIGALFAAMSATADSQVVSGTVPPVVANLQPIGQLEGTNELHLAIGLPLRNQ
jgi:hypothetical protein